MPWPLPATNDVHLTEGYLSHTQLHDCKQLKPPLTTLLTLRTSNVIIYSNSDKVKKWPWNYYINFVPIRNQSSGQVLTDLQDLVNQRFILHPMPQPVSTLPGLRQPHRQYHHPRRQNPPTVLLLLPTRRIILYQTNYSKLQP